MKNSSNYNSKAVKFAWNVAFYAGIAISTLRRARTKFGLLAFDAYLMLRDKDLKEEMFKRFLKQAVVTSNNGQRRAKVTKVLPDKGHLSVVYFTVEGTNFKGTCTMPAEFCPEIGEYIDYNGDLQ